MPDSLSLGHMVRGELDAIAAAAIDLLYTADPTLAARYGEHGRAKCREDIAMHFLCLADALDAESVDIFRNYASWARSVMRKYGVEDAHIMQSFKLMAAAVHQRVPAAYQAAAALIEQAIADLEDEPVDVPCAITPTRPHAELAQQYLEALLNRERARAIQLIVDLRLPLREIFLHVFTPALREVGRLWQSRQIGVDVEHFCTSATREFMARLGHDVIRPPAKHLTILGVGVSQELHEVGLRMVCDCFEFEGWNSVYIGGNTPTHAIMNAIVREKPDVLALSATAPFFIHKVREIIRRVHAEHPDVFIMVGGNAFNGVPQLWRRIGADGYAADPTEALQVATKLVGGG